MLCLIRKCSSFSAVVCFNLIDSLRSLWSRVSAMALPLSEHDVKLWSRAEAPQHVKPRVLKGGVRRSRSQVCVCRPLGDCPVWKAVRGSGGCPKDQRFHSSAADSLFSLERELFPLNVIYLMGRPLRFGTGLERYAIHGGRMRRRWRRMERCEASIMDADVFLTDSVS